MAKIDEILRAAVIRKASDIHFSAESRVMFRQHGDLVALDEKVYSNAELQELLLEIVDEKDKKRLLESKNLDRSYSVPDCGNFRLNLFWTRRGIGAVIRWLPTRMPEIDDLGMPPVIKKLAELPKGLLLVTGPTGSGKSTTLAAIINYMNTNFSYHILTIEDPVEFVHPCKTSLINQREIGQSCLTYADALKYALREDPDVILVGEMRDQETIGLALTAAETGHLVLGTLHTRGAASAVDRIIESFPATERPLIRVMLSESLCGVISQVLLKAREGNARVAAYEVLVSNYAVSNLIREGKTFQIQSILQTAKGEGMLQMEAHIRQLMAEGKVDLLDAEAALQGMGRSNQNAAPASSSSVPVSNFQKSAQSLDVHAPNPTVVRPANAKATAARAPLNKTGSDTGKEKALSSNASVSPTPPVAQTTRVEAVLLKPSAPLTYEETSPSRGQTSSIKIEAPPPPKPAAPLPVEVPEERGLLTMGEEMELLGRMDLSEKTVAGITIRPPRSESEKAASRAALKANMSDDTSSGISLKSIQEGTNTVVSRPTMVVGPSTKLESSAPIKPSRPVPQAPTPQGGTEPYDPLTAKTSIPSMPAKPVAVKLAMGSPGIPMAAGMKAPPPKLPVENKNPPGSIATEGVKKTPTPPLPTRPLPGKKAG